MVQPANHSGAFARSSGANQTSALTGWGGVMRSAEPCTGACGRGGREGGVHVQQKVWAARRDGRGWGGRGLTHAVMAA